jgi:glycosyltransferase involved in cell wall biosynthesis
VLFVLTDVAVGGAEHQVLEVAMRLSERGWVVSIVSLIRPELDTRELEEAGITLEHLGITRSSWDPRAVIRLRRIVRGRRPRIVHSHMVHANLLTRVTRPLIGMRPPLICTSHSSSEGGRGRRLALRVTDPLATKTSHVSRSALERYVEQRIIAPDRAVWIPNGVDLERFRRSESMRDRVRRELGIDQGTFLWLTVGRQTALKNQHRLLQSFASLEGEPVLALAGIGELHEELKERAESSVARGRIVFLGPRNDPEALMSAADGFVLSSEHEALPMVLLEAASCELVMVATDVGGCGEVIDDGTTGRLADPSDPGALTEAMSSIMSLSVEERRRMGRAARTSMRERYDIETVTGRWEELYRTLAPGLAPATRSPDAV